MPRALFFLGEREREREREHRSEKWKCLKTNQEKERENVLGCLWNESIREGGDGNGFSLNSLWHEKC